MLILKILIDDGRQFASIIIYNFYFLLYTHALATPLEHTEMLQESPDLASSLDFAPELLGLAPRLKKNRVDSAILVFAHYCLLLITNYFIIGVKFLF